MTAVLKYAYMQKSNPDNEVCSLLMWHPILHTGMAQGNGSHLLVEYWIYSDLHLNAKHSQSPLRDADGISSCSAVIASGNKL